MLVKVRSFIILTDFVILNFEEYHEILILLGRPFLETSKSTIDLEKKELTMKINGDMEIFKCDHQQDEINREGLRRSCCRIFATIPNNLKKREVFSVIRAGRKHRYKEWYKRNKVEQHEKCWTNTDINISKEISLCTLFGFSDESNSKT